MAKVITDEKLIDKALSRGVEEIIGKEDLKKAMLSGQRLRIKLGIDPTSPNIHLGRSIPLLKLKDFQDLGHQIVFIIGDFTGVIGDTSDKESERPMLDKKIVEQNMKNYEKQAGKILDIRKCEVQRNSKWLGKLKYAEIGTQADNFSLSDFISRENIKKRLDAGVRVSLRELLYPLMQGYDSVAIRSDVELGGTDQRFNLLAGRKMQEAYKQKPQSVITGPILEGTDGRKMSSSWGNTVNLTDEAKDMFGKIMSLPDNLIIKYFTLATRVPEESIKEYEKALAGSENPKKYKLKLAREIVRMYHGEKEATGAEENFEKLFSKKEIPDDILELILGEAEISPVDLIILSGVAESKSEAKRLIEQGALEVGGRIERDIHATILAQDGDVVRVGKKYFARLRLSSGG
ncbi:MAG: tyrosyl-tRNA synthetase [Parcubacteria group bacterium LiPW_15]|nr:MAG: tyrosyl-tRNA synthetase [Parcubacteria group bacterium LiPW_15]